MANPALNDQALRRLAQGEGQAGWGAPTGTFPTDRTGPLTPASYETMTVSGATTATAVLLVLLIGSAIVGWNAVEATPFAVNVPSWIIAPLIAALALGFVTIFKPNLARITGPLYALSEGVVVGAISKVYNVQYSGIVLNAGLGTVGVAGVMLFLYATRIIKVTEKMRMVVSAAMGAIFLVFMVNFVMSLFGSEVPFLNDASPLGILISVAIIVVAAFMLLLDFDFIERSVRAGAPKSTEWYAGFAVLIHLVWIYLELLRLLAKLQRR